MLVACTINSHYQSMASCYLLVVSFCSSLWRVTTRGYKAQTHHPITPSHLQLISSTMRTSGLPCRRHPDHPLTLALALESNGITPPLPVLFICMQAAYQPWRIQSQIFYQTTRSIALLASVEQRPASTSGPDT